MLSFTHKRGIFMATVRVNKNANYTVVSNIPLKDQNLSLRAKGLLMLMLSLPDNWDYSVRGLTAICKEKIDTIRSTLKELEENCYLVRTRVQDEKGKFNYIYDIFEQPQGIKPCTEKPHTVSPYTEKPTQLNTKELNTKNKVKNINNTNTYNTYNREEENASVSVSVGYLNDFFERFEIKEQSDRRKILSYLQGGMKMEVIENGLTIPFTRNVQQFDFETDQSPIKDPVSYGMSIIENWFNFGVRTLEDAKKYNKLNRNREVMM